MIVTIRQRIGAGSPYQTHNGEQSMLDRKSYFIREHVGLLKLSDTYDIIDPETQQTLGTAREHPGVLIHLLRLAVDRQILPTKVVVYKSTGHSEQGEELFSIHRGLKLLRSKVIIKDANGQEVGYLKSKLLSIGGAFTVHDANDSQIAELKGDWKGWNFRFLDMQGKEMGNVTKKWSGLGKELFTTADNYIISLNETPTPQNAMLLLAAGLAVDIVYKEG
jgi:uncharacterized protein YxjI